MHEWTCSQHNLEEGGFRFRLLVYVRVIIGIKRADFLCAQTVAAEE